MSITGPRILTDTQREAVRVMANPFGVTVYQVLSERRTQAIVLARHAACHMLRERFGMSYPEIGAVLNRDHSTVMNSIARYRERLWADASFRERVENGLARMGGR